MIQRVSLLITVFSASLLFWVAVPQVYRASNGIAGYLTVVTDLDHEEARTRLRAAGVRSVIGPDETQVHLSRFLDTELVPLSSALEQLDPLDPRRDPYIRGLERFFYRGDLRTLYAAFDDGPMRASRLVARTLGAGSSVAEYAPYRRVFSLVAVLAVVALLWKPSSSRLNQIVLPAIAWLPAVVAYDIAMIVPAVLGLSYAVFGASWTDRDRTGRVAALVTALVAALGLGYAARYAGPGAIGAIAAAIAGELAILRIPRARRSFVLDPDHKPFVPVDLVRGADLRRGRTQMIVLALLAIGLPLLGDAFVPGARFDRPVVERAGDLDPPSMVRLWSQAEPRALPDLADYLAHRAFQEGFPYGREYGFPTPGETVDLLRVTERADGTYESRLEPVIRFDFAWFESALASTPPGIPTMLASLDEAVTVVLAREEALYSGILAMMIHVLLVSAGFAPAAVLVLSKPTIAGRRDPIVELLRRRRRVA